MSNGSAGATAYVSLATFAVPPGGKYPIFLAGIFVYLFCVLCNVTLLAAIALRRHLHKPVYFILLSLPLNDLMGVTAMLPKVLAGVVAESNRTPYPLCVLQAFLLHLYGGGILFILAAMAFDRYVAICMPLRYNTVMTPGVVVGVVTAVWTLDLVLITALFSLQSGLRRCRSDVANVFCDNPSLLKLMCGDTSVNNVVGLVSTAVVQALSLSVQVFSYVKILMACDATGRTEPRKKAVNTCVAQLLILIIFEIAGTFTILSHRFQNVSGDLQKAMGVLIFLISPLLNPLVYGLYTSEIRNALLVVLKKRVFV
ncbi:olfactory receptor 146-like [Hippocampus zosterae]|uniref:olfactory receptor 146-like n=1 Tax=Hippocampus zosterae TaxID=109293 RepID=UPI00223D61C9|nr:olfactory receptor 146-like [Hippocampus zosterae]